MPKFRISARVVGSKYIGEFEAATKEEAERMAEKSGEIHVSLCHQCAHECEDPECDELYIDEVEPD